MKCLLDLETWITGPKSRLASVDLHKLINRNTWQKLPEESKLRLLSLFPETDAKIIEKDGIPHMHDHLRHSIDAFQNYLMFDTLGLMFGTEKEFVDIGYIRSQLDPSESDLADETWKDENFISYMGEQTHRMAAQAGESAAVTLGDLFKRNYLKIGDKLEYRKSFVHYDAHLSVTVKIRDFQDPVITCSYKNAKQEEVTGAFNGLNALETNLFNEFVGKNFRKPNGNAWKATFLKRDSKKSLFHLRKDYLEQK